MSATLNVIRLVARGQCPVFNRNAPYFLCMRSQARGGNCSLCDFTRSLPVAARKLILRFWLMRCSDEALMNIVHEMRAAGGD